MKAKHEQVADQCRAVIRLANAIAELHYDLAMSHEQNLIPDLVDMHGQLTHRLMNQLGDIVNGRDAATEEDIEAVGTIFDEARKMFPLAQGGEK